MEAVISPLMEKIIEKFQRTVLVLYRAVNDVVKTKVGRRLSRLSTLAKGSCRPGNMINFMAVAKTEIVLV